jgi:hypothetical protein
MDTSNKKEIVMKTAVDWLVDHLYWVIPDSERNFLEGLRKEALVKEKEQIKEAWYNGGINGMGLFETNTGEEYYNQTYNQNK